MPQELYPLSETDARARAEEHFLQATDAEGRYVLGDPRAPGTPAYDLKRLVAVFEQRVAARFNTVLNDTFPLTASTAGLDRFGRDTGQPRRGAVFPTGTVQFQAEVTGATLQRLYGESRIPSGTRLTLRDGGGVRLRTLEHADIPPSADSVTVAVQAERATARTAAASGAELEIELAGPLRSVVRASVGTDVTGGAVRESDDEYRYRLMRAFVNPTTYDGFVRDLLTHPGVASAEAVAGAYGAGTVQAFVTPSRALPEPGLRAELEALWGGVSGAYVLFPDYEGLVFRIRVEGAANTAGVVDYVNNLAVGDRLVIEQIEALMLESGAVDAQVVGLKRAHVTEEGEAVDPRRLIQITNLTPRSSRSKWYTRADWITICR